MEIRQSFLAQLSYLEGAVPSPDRLPSLLATSCFEVLPVAAASISVFSTDGFRFPVGASSARAAYAERLQFTTGEGPALDLRADGDGILADETVVSSCWPLFHERLFVETPFRAVAAFPVIAGADVFAAVDLYFTSADDLRRLPLSDALAVVSIIGERLADAMEYRDRWTDNPVSASRSVTATAVRMLAAATKSSTEDALRRLQTRAAAARITVDAFADAVVSGRVSLDDLTLAGAGRPAAADEHASREVTHDVSCR
ncbi:hypothetical protein [Nakamurella deserti]|uniref:hypothetical protein n=1 Tax=Nakamurella deserti TaxID=2164074 RepID=UPI000DBE6530|nr:hypothetical protein [Nakamurella deserti]